MRIASLKHWGLFSAPLLIVLGLLWFGFATEADVAAFFKQHRAAHPGLKLFMKVITDWSNPLLYAVWGIMLIMAIRAKDHARIRFILILLVVQGIVAGLCVHLLKNFIGRPRPGAGEWYKPLSTRGAFHSLPSGHTTEIIGWTLPMALRDTRFWLTALFSLFIALVGFSRIYLGWHHPSDVFFGWLLGSFGGFATIIIANTSFFTRKA